MSTYEELRRLDLAYVFHPCTLLADHLAKGPTIFSEGKGPYLYDIQGKQYLDCRAGLFCVNVGYGDEEVAQAAYEQMRRVQFVTSFTSFASEPLIELSAKLASLLPEGLSRVLLLNSGSEVNEAAIKLARYLNALEGRPRKNKIVGRKLSYHGATYGIVALTDLERAQAAATPLPSGFLRIDAPYCYRCPYGKTYPACGVDCAWELERLIQREGPDTVAAFLGEPVMQIAGAIVPPKEYWPIIRQICDKYAVWFIADEVITGLGRTGKMFALEHWGVWPDVLTTSKAMGAGYFPVGATVFREEIYQRLLWSAPNPSLWHGFTMSGNPVGCAVALKNIEIVEERGLVGNARRMGERLLEGLKKFEELPIVGEVRGLGLFCALEAVRDKQSKEPLPESIQRAGGLVKMAMDRGLLVRSSPTRNDLAVITPPLIVNEEQIDFTLEVIGDSLQALQRQLS
ncbi:MAG: aspartate aminotransferase family protein [Dehalococcoidales bacterium]|nr:aspartate aminotransferase family protein [Dehalococcoidales bacterium]